MSAIRTASAIFTVLPLPPDTRAESVASNIQPPEAAPEVGALVEKLKRKGRLISATLSSYYT
jgi:hypothetical protein